MNDSLCLFLLWNVCSNLCVVLVEYIVFVWGGKFSWVVVLLLCCGVYYDIRWLLF